MPKCEFIDPKFIRKPGKITFTDIPVNAYKKTVSEERKNFSDKKLMQIYTDICTLREFESMLFSIKTQGEYNGFKQSYPGPAHLSLGQEAAAVGQAYLLTTDDYAFGSHRSHSEILAKGLSSIHQLSDDELMEIMENFLGGKTLKAIQGHQKTKSVKELATDFLIYGALAEIFARQNGFHHGLGGSMHAFFLPFGIYPNNAIVGGSGPIALGSALYKKCNDKKGIVVANIGDGSLGCGPVLESLNFAAMDQFTQLW
ncbi:MAG TPA: thiamine pyrophosphate-dependent enzyme, partial [Clostridiales bacterium]|nr:thiamine pyrophosphate-dependent enzyme [Clostridiales bacterium]